MNKNFRFQTKLFLYYSIIVIIILGTALIVFYSYISGTLKKHYVQNFAQLTYKTSEQLDSMLTQMDRLALYIVLNPTIGQVFSEIKTHEVKSNYFDVSVDDMQKVGEALIPIYVPNISSMRLSLYNINGDYISAGTVDTPNVIRNRTGSNEYTGWYNRLIADTDNFKLLPPHQDFWSDDKELKLLSIIRAIKDTKTGLSYGLVEVQQDYATLESICKIDSISNTSVNILTSDGDVIYPLESTNNKIISDFYLNKIQSNSRGSFSVYNPINRQSEIVAYSKSSSWDCFCYCVVSEDTLFSPIYLIGNIILLIGISMLLITLTIIYLITNQLTMPLKELERSIKSVTLENLSLEIGHSDSSNEIVQLNQAFNAMFKRLNDSIFQEVKSHLLALQSQMNPHFLYNMLSIISATGQDIGSLKIMDMCHKLSNMLRYVTSYSESYIPLRSEVEHTKNFLDLMKERYEDYVIYDIEIDESVLDINVPKLILQPLVENCFQHGFSNVEPPWKIKIAITRNQKQWFVSVTDNGDGFDDTVLNDILEKLEEFTKNPAIKIQDLKLGGLGLLNTLIRLKLLYQHSMVFKVENHSPTGTQIIIGGSTND